MRTADGRTTLAWVELLRESLRTTPHEAALWADVAELLMEAGNLEMAVRDFDMALLLDADLHRAKIGLSIALDANERDLSGRDPPQMRAVLQESLQALDALARVLREGGTPPFVDVQELRAERAVRRRLAADPEDADALFLQSALLAKHGAFGDAIALLDRLADAEVDYPGAARFRERLQELAAASGEVAEK